MRARRSGAVVNCAGRSKVVGAKDGEKLGVNPKMGAGFWLKSVAMVASKQWSEAMALHWTGLGVFICQFRRPLFSVLHEIFHNTLVLRETPGQPWNDSVDEVLLLLSLLPLAFTTRVRRTISCSVASPSGGGTAEAKAFISSLSLQAERSSLALHANVLE